MNPFIRQIIFIVVLLGVPVAAFFLVFKPQHDEMKKLQGDNEIKKQMLSKLRAVTAQAPDLVKATDEIKSTITAIEARLPNSKELDSVLRDVATIAGSCGLRVPKFNRSEGNREAGTAHEQQLEVEVQGDFDGYYKFLLGLEKLPRITRITDMQLSRIANMDKNKDGMIRANFKLSIYYQQGQIAEAGANP